MIPVKVLTLLICSPDSRLLNSTTELNALIRKSLFFSSFSWLILSCAVLFSSFFSREILCSYSSIIFNVLRMTTEGAKGLYIISAAPSSYAFTSLSTVASPVIIITGIWLISAFSFMYFSTSRPFFLGICKSRNISATSPLCFSSCAIASSPSSASYRTYCSSKISFRISLLISMSSTINNAFFSIRYLLLYYLRFSSASTVNL